MVSRAWTSAFPLALACLALSSCARKHAALIAPPAPAPVLTSETGLASWYGHPYHGRRAANGEIYDMQKLTAAHRTLPFGTWVRVTNLTNDKSVDVRITDRGPFVDGRVIDLSHAGAEAIGLIGAGVARVRLDILSAPEITPAENWYTVQAGAFQDKDRAERLRISLQGEYGPARIVMRTDSPTPWLVLVGREPSENAAKALAERVRQKVGPAFVVRVDEAAPPVGSPGRPSTR